MKRRYQFLGEDDVFEALNKVRDALLASKSGEDVDMIMNGILTYDERIKVGRRILIAEYLISGYTMDEIREDLKVGSSTIQHVAARLDKYEKCFELIKRRNTKVEEVFEKKAYTNTGGSIKVKRTRSYTGFKRKQVGR